MNPTASTALLSLLPIIHAQTSNFAIQGPNKPGPGESPEALRISEEAGRNPAASTLNTFSLTYNNEREDSQWRVNISSFPVPNAAAQFGNSSANYSENVRAANIQYMLDWPGEDEVFQEYLRGRNMSLTFRVKISDKPASVTNSFANDGKGDCKSVLGDTCVRSIKLAAQAEAVADESDVFEGLEGCGETLNAAPREGTTDGGGKFTYGIVPPANGSVVDSLPLNSSVIHRRGSVLWYQTSKTYTPGNGTDEVESAKRALHVMVVSYTYRNRQFGLATGADVLCAIPEKATDGQSAARGWRRSMCAVWGMAALSAVVVMWC